MTKHFIAGSRPWFRRIVAVLGAGAMLSGALVACSAPAPSAPPTTAVPSSSEEPTTVTPTGKTVRIWAAHYTPTESMEATPENPYPRQALRVIADEWTKLSGTEVEIIEMGAGAGTDERTWNLTQLNSGNPPEIMNIQSFFAAQDKPNDWWVKLDDYLDQPNPYVEGDGNAKWSDEFYQLPLGTRRDSDGELFVIPVDLVTTMFFYNKTAFAEAGIQEPPTTYAEFLTDLQQLKDKTEYVPVSPFSFSKLQLGEQVVAPWKDKIEATGIGGAYTMRDITEAILDGRFSADSQEYRDWMKLLKDALPYWSSDWAVEGTDWGQRFTEGKLAVLEDGTWRYGMLDANDQLGFEWGTFFMPVVEAGTGSGQAPSATGGVAPSIGGASGVQLGITYSAEKNGVLDETVDFLRYLTAPTQMERMVNELGQFLPTAKAAKVNPLLESSLKAVTDGVGEAGMILYYDKVGLDAQIALQNLTTQYLQDAISLDELAVESQKAYMTAAETNKKNNGW